jgi:FAD/FMN-containing dehydrogenase
MRSDLLPRLQAILGPAGLLTDPADIAPFAEDWRKLYRGRSVAVARPGSAAEVAAVVALCAAHNVAVVPQGGNTSMVGGAVPSEDGGQLVMALSRLNRVRGLDRVDMTMTVEAGVTLKAAQDAAAEAGMVLPLSISSEGSAQIGGVLATNAGGNFTVRYGNARDMVLGMEVVLADGQIWHGLRQLHKDNTGYCLRQLFAGSEGTLGIITAAVLKLRPKLRSTELALCAVATPADALAVYTRFRDVAAETILAFEYMSGIAVDMVLKHMPQVRLPLSAPAPHYVLLKLASSREDAGLRALIERELAGLMEEGQVQDAVLAESEAQQASMWRLREELPDAQRLEGASVKNDVSVPVSRAAEFIARAAEACELLMPGIRVVPFGHMGDGNIHFNLEQPVAMAPEAFLAHSHAIMDTVNAVVKECDGSFSAEHGVGKLKTYLMPEWRGGAELDLMRRIKAALDPAGLLNPGKVLA